MAIDIGAAAIDRPTNIGASAYTKIQLTNPATSRGTIDTIEVWFDGGYANCTGLRVGTFYLVSGTTYKCRDSATLGDVTAGSKQTFTTDSDSAPLAIAVEIGDYIGNYSSLPASYLEATDTGGSGVRSVLGEYIDPGDQVSYGGYEASRLYSLYATGQWYSAPTVTTVTTVNITETTALGRGTITDIGSALVTEHGHCWSTSANPTTSDSKTTKGAGEWGGFVSNVTGLTAGTTYHIRAYVTNTYGTGYGSDLTFVTLETDSPTVTTEACTSLTSTTATGNGTILSIGASSVTQHGHCWGTSVNPTTASSKTSQGLGTVGTFTSAITGLVSGTTYYIRAYATNTAGTSYGNNIILIADASSIDGVAAIRVKKTMFQYFDAYGIQRYIEGTPVGE